MEKVSKAIKGRKPKKKRERKLTYAEDLGLICRQYKAGSKDPCGRLAEFFEPGIGDVCSEHKRSEKAIRYSRKPKVQEVAA